MFPLLTFVHLQSYLGSRYHPEHFSFRLFQQAPRKTFMTIRFGEARITMSYFIISLLALYLIHFYRVRDPTLFTLICTIFHIFYLVLTWRKVCLVTWDIFNPVVTSHAYVTCETSNTPTGLVHRQGRRFNFLEL